jgi:GNAT superfamily N-acetyltransferase
MIQDRRWSAEVWIWLAGPVRPSLPADTPRIRRAGPDDADSWVRTYLDALAATYSTLLPPEFLAQQRAARLALVERYRSVFTAQLADPQRLHRAWYAHDAIGPVGIVEVRTGPTNWELDRGFPPPGSRRQLVKLYTLPRAQGTGLGQALLNTAIGADDAYLWIMAGNPRAEAFYRRNRFVPDGLTTEAGPTWFHRAMFRMHRTRPAPGRLSPKGDDVVSAIELVHPVVSSGPSPRENNHDDTRGDTTQSTQGPRDQRAAARRRHATTTETNRE